MLAPSPTVYDVDAERVLVAGGEAARNAAVAAAAAADEGVGLRTAALEARRGLHPAPTPVRSGDRAAAAALAPLPAGGGDAR